MYQIFSAASFVFYRQQVGPHQGVHVSAHNLPIQTLKARNFVFPNISWHMIPGLKEDGEEWERNM